MGEMMMIYAAVCLIASATSLPSSSTGFMPFQENYWLWKIIGFGGLAMFQARWIVQWLHSERRKESVIPVAFWWLSLIGSLMELMYFLRQQDSVGIGGYCISAVPYTRNLMLVYKKKRELKQKEAVEFPVVGEEQ